MVTSPASLSFAIVVPDSNSGLSSTSTSTPSPPPHAASDSDRPTAAISALVFLNRMLSPSFLTGSQRPAQSGDRSVLQDLAEEVLGTVRSWVGEELVRGVLLDDLPVGHEHDPVRRGAGEPHLVGDDNHRHAALCEVDHDV